MAVMMIMDIRKQKTVMQFTKLNMTHIYSILGYKKARITGEIIREGYETGPG